MSWIYVLIGLVVFIVFYNFTTQKGGFKTSNNSPYCRKECSINSMECESCRCWQDRSEFMNKCNESFLNCKLEPKLCANNYMMCQRNHACL